MASDKWRGPAETANPACDRREPVLLVPLLTVRGVQTGSGHSRLHGLNWIRKGWLCRLCCIKCYSVCTVHCLHVHQLYLYCSSKVFGCLSVIVLFVCRAIMLLVSLWLHQRAAFWPVVGFHIIIAFVFGWNLLL